jgi:hypothetical protein
MQNFIVSKLLVNGVAVHNLKLDKIKWVLNWTMHNPTQIAVLASIMRQLNRDGMKTFGRCISYAHYKSISNPIIYAKRALKYQKLRIGIRAVNRAIDVHGKTGLTLSNGVKCIATFDKNGGYVVSLLNCGTRIRLRMWVTQVVFIKNFGTKNVKTLKRLAPREIQYFREGRWHVIPRNHLRATMSAIAETIPLEIGFLLTD